jgi:hypothetical protein
MRQRGIRLDRATFDRLTPAVDRWMTTEIDRYVLGTEMAFRANLRGDPVMRVAIAAAEHAATPRDLVAYRVTGVSPPADSSPRGQGPTR